MAKKTNYRPGVSSKPPKPKKGDYQPVESTIPIINGDHYVFMPSVGAVLDDNKLYPAGISLDEWARSFPPKDSKP